MTATHRQTDGQRYGPGLSGAPPPRRGQTQQAAREPLPAAGTGPVPCPPRLAPASWGAAPHTPARRGPLGAGTWPHLETEGVVGPGPLGGHLRARPVVPRLCSDLWSPLEVWRGCPQGWTQRQASETGPSPGAATQTGWLAGAALPPGRPGPALRPPTLTPSEPACRVWPPLPRPPAALPRLPLRSPPANTRGRPQGVLARPLPCLPEAPHPEPHTCKRLPQHPDLLGGRRGPWGAACLGWAWFRTCSRTCGPTTASWGPGPAGWGPDTERGSPAGPEPGSALRPPPPPPPGWLSSRS